MNKSESVEERVKKGMKKNITINANRGMKNKWETNNERK